MGKAWLLTAAINPRTMMALRCLPGETVTVIRAMDPRDGSLEGVSRRKIWEWI